MPNCIFDNAVLDTELEGAFGRYICPTCSTTFIRSTGNLVPLYANSSYTKAADTIIAHDSNGARAATFVVAASNASFGMRNTADYVCDGTADDIQIQAALDALPSEGGTVLLSEGTFTTSATITLDRGQNLIGSSRRGTSIRPATQTFAAITVPALGARSLAVVEWKLSDFTISYATATGGAIATNAAAIGINMLTSGQNYPYQFTIENITIVFAYDGIRADASPFMYRVSNVYVSEFRHWAFSSLGGTTQTYTNVYAATSAAGARAFHFVGVNTLALINAAADNIPAGSTKVYIESCRPTIAGFFMESNTVGNGESLIHFSGSRGIITGIRFWNNNTFSPSVGQEAYGIRLTDSSDMTIIGPHIDAGTNTGTGTSYQVVVGNGDSLFITNHSIAAATGTGTNYGIYTATGTLAIGQPATITGTQTLTNKTLSSPVISGSVTTASGDLTLAPASATVITPTTSPGFTVFRNAFTLQENRVRGAQGSYYYGTDNIAEVVNGATRTIKSSLTNVHPILVYVINSTDTTSAIFILAGGTVTKLGGSTQWVAGAPAGGEIGVELSAGTLRINNNIGANKFVSFGISYITG